ncbi:phosphoribosylformylglycinamidine synthase I [Candidatus Thorarchaeota archaeon]|nr:MAG: phosphoribosylformylglycinamidine synthase I [Candidatus Thorarchaeota archaeon]
MAIAVLRFPGTNNEQDIIRVLKGIQGADPYLVPSRQGPTALQEADGVVIPGGFSYGDYLRAGAVASVGDIMEGVKELIDEGKPVLGICNGFQVLAESGHLPGALLTNESARFICKWVYLKVSEHTNRFTQGLENAIIRVPIAHAEGNYFCSNDILDKLVSENQIAFRYCDKEGNISDENNPNGSIMNIAGIVNEQQNVMGMMPHPERASRIAIGSRDGILILENFVRETVC